MSTDLLSTTEAAEFLNLKPSTLRKWRVKGSGPRYFRTGRGPMSRAAYRRSDLDAWLAARAFTSTSQETANGPEREAG